MSPVLGSISVFGVRPWLAGVVGLASLVLLTASVLTPALASVFAPDLSAALTWLGVHVGWPSSATATAPATIGAAIEVPPARMYWPLPKRQVGHSVVKTLLGARLETMREPGA